MQAVDIISDGLPLAVETKFIRAKTKEIQSRKKKKKKLIAES